MRTEKEISYNNGCTENVEPTLGWYEKEVERLIVENEKLKKLVDILLERELDL